MRFWTTNSGNNFQQSFRSVIASRSHSSGAFRFGFNGKEKDDETFEGSLAFEAVPDRNRESLDIRMGEYPWQRPYAYFANSPIAVIDYLGMGALLATGNTSQGCAPRQDPNACQPLATNSSGSTGARGNVGAAQNSSLGWHAPMVVPAILAISNSALNTQSSSNQGTTTPAQSTPSGGSLIIESAIESVRNGVNIVKPGPIEIPDNVFNRAIQKGIAENRPTFTDFSLNPTAATADLNILQSAGKLNNYNCWGSCQAALSDKEIEGSATNTGTVTSGCGQGDANIFDQFLVTGCKNIKNTNKLIFGKSIGRFSTSSNKNVGGTSHGAIYFGTSKNGTIYFFSKNGWQVAPEIMASNSVSNVGCAFGALNCYGPITPVGKDKTGFYKKRR